MGQFSQDALRKRAKDIESKYANGDPDTQGESPDELDAQGYDGGDEGGDVGVDTGGESGPGYAPAEKPKEPDPFEARWKSRIDVLAGKMRAEFGITSDAEQDDSLTPEQRYKLMQADYNAAVGDRRRGGEGGAPVVQQPAQQMPEQDADADEVERELATLFGDEEVAKSLSQVVRRIASKEAEGRVKPVESQVQRSAESDFASKVWGGPLGGIDHSSEHWAEFNSHPVPFGGGKTMADVMREAHASRDFKTFEAVRAEFDQFTGKAPAAASPAASKGFASIATGGRRSAASVTGDNTSANIDNLRAQIQQAQRAAERGDLPWAKVRELRSQMSAAYIGQ